jgi:uncharacterized iron-regulated membrane protein
MKRQGRSSWPKVRKFLNDIHLWLGLSSGIVVLLICLSGTIYVFNTEIREFSQPAWYHVKPSDGSRKMTAEALIARVSKETDGKVTSIKIPSDPLKSYILTVRPEESKTDERGRERSPAGNAPAGGSIQYMVDPYTGAILGNNQIKTPTVRFMTNMFSLHRWLLLDKIEKPIIGELPNKKLGSYITGTATILFTLGVITGIFIWFPRKIKNWKQGLGIRWSANWKRINHDLHSTFGIYSCLLLFFMGITGPQFSFPWYREYLRRALGTYQPVGEPRQQIQESSVSQKNESRVSLSIAEYLNAANRTLNYQGENTITLPADSAGAVVISKTHTGFFSSPAPDKVSLDRYDASVLQTDIFKNKPFRERVSGSIKAIHVGEVYGTFTKLLYFFACLVATTLPVTGTLIWINKLKKQARPIQTAPI